DDGRKQYGEERGGVVDQPDLLWGDGPGGEGCCLEVEGEQRGGEEKDRKKTGRTGIGRKGKKRQGRGRWTG
ncbi:hypothetical protein ACC674_38245, partial [Rhizobium ruizarguesonis]